MAEQRRGDSQGNGETEQWRSKEEVTAEAGAELSSGGAKMVEEKTGNQRKRRRVPE